MACDLLSGLGGLEIGCECDGKGKEDLLLLQCGSGTTGPRDPNFHILSESPVAFLVVLMTGSGGAEEVMVPVEFESLRKRVGQFS